MRKTTAAPAILFCLALAIASLPAWASESFTLKVPVRFNANQETGEVRVTLSLDAAPAGAQLVVNGSTTLNLGDTTLVGADSVAFTAGAGNSVQITYRPLSNFGGDFCLGGSAVEQNVPMRFSGAQDVTEFRVTTYVVAAPDVDCSKPTKRTAEEPASLIPTDDGVAPALVALNRGRHPLDIALVLDKSGSMSSLPPEAGGGATKHEILKSALEAFLATWMEIDAPAGEGEWSQDRIGVVFFDSSAASQAIAGADAPANFFVRRGDTSPHPWDNVISSVLSLTPGGSTSIGDGINEAMQQWVADPLNDLSLIVVTDGMQNTAPLITPAPSGLLGLVPVSGLPLELYQRSIPIRTIGFGTPAAVDDALLKNIALETAGVSYIAISSVTMFDTFANTLVSILKGNTASLAMRRQGTLTGAGPGLPESVVVDPSAQRVVFLLQWAPPRREALELEVLPPGASIAATPTSSQKTPQASIQSFDVQPADVGTWTVRVKRGLSVEQHPVPYTLNVFFLEQKLDYRLTLDQIHPGTGDAIRVRANVSYAGKPLAGLPADAIRVRIQRPSEGLGTILHDTHVDDNATGPTTTPTGDIQSPYDRKLAALGSDVLNRVLPRDVATISLQDEKNGVYTGTFPDTSTPGTYGFEVVLDWNDARTGHVRREERLEHHVKVKPDAAMTEIATSRSGDTVLISVTPRDRFGNYLGPGYASLVSGTLKSSGTLVAGAPVDRDQTGTYQLTVADVPAGEVPDFEVVVDGIVVGNPSPSGGGSTSKQAWRFFLDAGPNFAHDDFLKTFGGKWSVNAGIERQLSPDWSIEGILGYHRFDTAASTTPHIWQLSLNGKRFFGTAPLRPFVNAGLGAYNLDPGDETRAGANAGIGVLYEFTSTCGVEAAWNYHRINIDNDNASFSTLQIGVRFAF
jgi:opacity protein-like surface antigen